MIASRSPSSYKISRAPPKVYQLLIKTHKTTIFITTAPTSTFASVKAEVLSALTADVNEGTDTPKVSSDDDFDICKPFKEKGRPTGSYEIIDPSLQVKQAGINNWEHLYIKFKDPETGEPLPIAYTKPSFEGEEDEEVVEWHESQESMSIDLTPSLISKGKRKAPPE